MSGMLDTNILVYAVNQEGPRHEPAKAYLSDLLASPGPWYLCWAIVYEFLRVVTHPKVFASPLPWRDAWQFLEVLLGVPNVELLYESEEHAEVLEMLLESVRNPSGNLMHDCHIAALLKENGVGVLYTHDTDFRLFPFLKVIDPFE
ncbi:MAG: PIN domain-containing protein [Deltaproteobacteria bacterium]|nr:PIN domain-containing protein [Deltaproteobacteria bacterium]